MSTYRFAELVGTSTKSWGDAAKQALEDAREGIKELRVAEVTRMDLKLMGATVYYRVRLKVSFKVESLKNYTELFEVGPPDLDDD